MITGLLVSAAALMIACTCSRLLTLNAGRPYPFSAAWSSSCRIETRGIAVSVDDSARRGAARPRRRQLVFYALAGWARTESEKERRAREGQRFPSAQRVRSPVCGRGLG